MMEMVPEGSAVEHRGIILKIFRHITDILKIKPNFEKLKYKSTESAELNGSKKYIFWEKAFKGPKIKADLFSILKI